MTKGQLKFANKREFFHPQMFVSWGEFLIHMSLKLCTAFQFDRGH